MFEQNKIIPDIDTDIYIYYFFEDQSLFLLVAPFFSLLLANLTQILCTEIFQFWIVEL